MLGSMWAGLVTQATPENQQPAAPPRRPKRALKARPVGTPVRKAYVREPVVYDNRWNLTPGEARALSTVVRLFTMAAVAAELGVGVKAVEGLLSTARKKMEAANTLEAALRWDRESRRLSS